MGSKFQLLFDSEHPDINSFQVFIQNSLELHQLVGVYEPDEIIAIACSCSEGQLTSDAIIEIHLSWLRTRCLEIIRNLSQQRENRRKFDIAVQALFDVNNPDAKSLWSNIARTLHQFRLSGTYDVREIITEAYSIGVRRIDSGTIIEKPLPWLRTTCLNIIRDFRRKQDKLDKPKLDNEGLTHGDEVLSRLIIAEDRKAICIALESLTPEEQQVLHARVLEGLSWQEVGESLSKPGKAMLNANAVRQKGFRVLQKLRQQYDAIRQEVQITEEDTDSI